ncbi:MAG TPA: hypothetical protein VKA04_12190, partial [Pseudodesulfovibrio sp.]|nr:hypothetical protein [Pseudodesulfovibrio sp.]
ILNFILQQPAANKLTKGLEITNETALTPHVSTQIGTFYPGDTKGAIGEIAPAKPRHSGL